MSNEKILALIRELRKSAATLPDGKRRDINNKLDRIHLALRNAPDLDETPDPELEHERQKMVVYRYLLEGHNITSLEAIHKFGITRLSAVIFDIGKMTGKAPSRRMIPVSNRYGKTVRVAEYWIENEGN